METIDFDKIFIYTKAKYFNWFLSFGSKKIICCNDISQALPNKKNILITCNVGHIIPLKIFSRFHLALNIHPGSYKFPGRDPHHWACYEKSKDFGATAHIMEKIVDSGKIIDYEIMKVTENQNPSDYHKIGNICAKKLSKRVIENLKTKNIFSKKVKWSRKSKKRIELIEMCNFKNLDDEEVNLRKKAFQGFEKFFNYS